MARKTWRKILLSNKEYLEKELYEVVKSLMDRTGVFFGEPKETMNQMFNNGFRFKYGLKNCSLGKDITDEDIQSGKLVPGTTPLSTWTGCRCDDTWYDVTKVFPKDYSVYCYVAPDEDQISFSCYDVTIIVDNATDEIVWMTTHSD